MRSVTVNENETIELDEGTLAVAKQMIETDRSLPVKLHDHILSFDDYTVGALRIGELNIEVKPRNNSFNLQNIFEMMLYVSTNNFNDNYSAIGFGDNQSFGIFSVSSQFYYECLKLLKFGLTGSFVDDEQVGKEIYGPIVLEKFNRTRMPVDGVCFLSNKYTKDIIPNQLIKSAILKLMNYGSKWDMRKKYQMLLKNFDNIKEYRGSLAAIENTISGFYSANKHYPIVLEFAIKILKDMRMSFVGGNVQWYSFLHNSNDIFEKYIRKIIMRGINAYVSKWDKPKTVAALDNGINKGVKSYVPDILIDYNPQSESARVVLDVKNKTFAPDIGDLSDALHSSDMYQLTFYCDKLKTKLGGLIYPANKNYTPVNVFIDGNQDFRFVLFSINMSETMRRRHQVLCQDIKDYLLYYS